eukprot:2347097-Amphidinium_carterae.1
MYGLRESPRIWEESRDTFLSTLSWDHVDAHMKTTPMLLRQFKVHPSDWAQSVVYHFSHLGGEGRPSWSDRRRSMGEYYTHEWTSTLEDIWVQLLVYVDDLCCASDRKINDSFLRPSGPTTSVHLRSILMPPHQVQR